ncbi:putative acyl-activating enzyme 5, peroxisomal [Vitis vinifera]|uniref:Putative acyl-activating enzyme 5, peroxisomal n=1 Tax=Vitis vinifera TaxID=29760 RepID=A0A438I6Y4_VITVI|nr:putative acyl-activating enzyme 5, peroxisomal [Vitis vinifera]
MEELNPSPANSSPLTTLSFLDRAATVYGDCPSVVYNSTTYTWSQTHHRCLQVASSIKSLGIGRGQVVSVVAPNIPAMYELHFAVPMAGAVLNTINTRLDARTVSVLLRHSESKLIFVDYQSRPLILESLSLFPPSSQRPLLVLITDDEDSPPSTVDFLCTYEDMVGRGDPEFKWIRPESEWNPMILNYTSGTTSSPKGVVHCHRGIFIVTVDSLIDWCVPKQPVYLWTLPMFHANGWSFPWGMAAVGGTNVCLRKFDASVIYEAIRVHRVTHMCGAPVVLNLLSNWPGTEPLKNPVQILTAGAPPRPPYCSGPSLEVLLSGTDCQRRERARLKSRQGVRTVGMTEVDVLDPGSGLSVKRDGSSLGEIVLRGGCIMLGYLKDPKGTSKSLTDDGWFFTGDVGVMHSDGYLEIKDRSKDVIISGGENLSSVEVESVLYTHPAVNEAAVVARPDDFWGETPCAFVSLKPERTEQPTEKEIMEYCRARMPHYMVPKTVVFEEELPKTSTGKIQKFVLRETAKAMGSSE